MLVLAEPIATQQMKEVKLSALSSQLSAFSQDRVALLQKGLTTALAEC